MKEIKGDLWEYHKQGNTICITTNSTVDNKRKLVMGKGTAKQAKDKYPELADYFAYCLDEHGLGLMYAQKENILAFPTKDHWKKPSKLDLIRESAKELQKFVDWHKKNPGTVEKVKFPIILPKPGCGAGELTWEQVKPVLESILSDDVHIIDKE